MKLSIVIIGNELLLGQVSDTNTAAIARALAPYGWEVEQVYTVGDSAPAIRQAVEQAMQASPLVITTGGLGPTKDDITKRVLLDIFGGELRWDPSVLDNVEQVFQKRGLQLNELTRQQALVPSSSRVIQNKLGTAPIMWFEREGRVLISMPGVPFETEGMLRLAVAQAVAERFGSDKEYFHSTLLASGITESGLAQRLDAYERQLPPSMGLAYLPTPGYIKLRLDGSCPKAEAEAYASEHGAQVEALRRELGPLLLHDGDSTPAQIALQLLRERGLTLATAESCTGGNIAHGITQVPGSSECFLGSVVSYCNSVKARVLGVSQADLDAHGAVSEPVVLQMAAGAQRCIGADCAVATSGIAGPGGAVPGKPVGTVWISARTPWECQARVFRFPGDRQRVIDRATTEALLMLIRMLQAPEQAGADR